MVNPKSLEIWYNAYKIFIAKDCLKFENKQQTKLFLVEVKPKSKETSKVVLPTAVCKTKMHKIEKNIEMLKKS